MHNSKIHLGELIGEAKYNRSGLLSSKDARVHIVIPAYETNPTKALRIGAKNGLTFFASISTGGSSSNLYFVSLKDNDVMEVKVKLLYRGSATNEFRIYYEDGYIYLQTRYSGLPSCIQPMANGALTSIDNNINFDKAGMIEAIYE